MTKFLVCWTLVQLANMPHKIELSWLLVTAYVYLIIDSWEMQLQINKTRNK